MRRWLYGVALALCVPVSVRAQSVLPDWTVDGYRELNYPNSQYYTGYAIERIPTNASLANELKKIEDAARNAMAESIIVQIQSDAQLVTQRESQQTDGHLSEQIVSTYKQQISTSTNAKTVGVEVRSCYDPSSNLGYAFAFVEKARLGEYYKGQITLLLQRSEAMLEAVEELVRVGKKIPAREKCDEAAEVLKEADQYRILCSAVLGADEEALQSERYRTISRRIEQKRLSLEQSTRVYVTCTWKDRNYPEYEEQAAVVEALVKQALSRQDCSIVERDDAADFVLTMTASTTQRSDGSAAAYGIISYYANVQGTLRNCHTDKTVASFAVVNDPHAYAAGKTDAAAVAKAFQSASLQQVILEAVLPKISN